MRILSAACTVLLFAACSRDTQPAPEPGPGLPAAAADAPDAAAPPADIPLTTEPAPGGETPGSAAPAPSSSGPSPQQPTATPTPRPATPAAVQPEPEQSAADGAAILRRAAAAYENVRSLRAEFVMSFENPLLRQKGTSRGTVYQRQPDRIALRFSDPEGDVIVGDGQYFWAYYPSNNAQQVVRAPASAAGEAAVNLQAQFIGNPVERFHYTLEGSESVAGREARVLNLVPRQRAEYRSLRVWVDDRDALVRRFEITEHNGSVKRFDLGNLQVNPSIPDAVFRFTPPEGVHIITPR